MIDFDEWLKEEFGDSLLTNRMRLTIKDAFEAGQQSQQSKIDELQARVDEALKILDGMKHNGAYRAIDILKGNKDEN